MDEFPEQQPELETLRSALLETPCEDTLWACVVGFQGVPFRTYSGLTFQYRLKRGRNGSYTKELFIDRRENNKSLAWSSVRAAFQAIQAPGCLVSRPKALGDIRGVTYIYAMFYRFGLIDVPEEAKGNMDPPAQLSYF